MAATELLRTFLAVGALLGLLGTPREVDVTDFDACGTAVEGVIEFDVLTLVDVVAFATIGAFVVPNTLLLLDC